MRSCYFYFCYCSDKNKQEAYYIWLKETVMAIFYCCLDILLIRQFITQLTNESERLVHNENN